ncbi:MAG TPA: histidine phosphatase family protein [Polyangiaceae bacterium]
MNANDVSLSVVRHARAVARGRCYGQSDVEVELSPCDAAARLRDANADWLQRVEVIWSSPWARTRLVAEVLGALIHRPVRVDARLSELHFGQWEGCDWDAIHRNDGARLAHWARDPMQHAPPGGERGVDLVARVSEWQRTVLGQRVLAVTHAGPIRALRALAQVDSPKDVSLDFERRVEHLVVERVVVTRRVPPRSES